MSRKPTCLVAYLARWIDRRCTQKPDWDASSQAVFSSVLSLVALWQKRCRYQPEPAPDRGTDDQQNRRSTAELEQHSTAGHICLGGNLPNICCLLKRRLNHRRASRNCQETSSKCSRHEPRAARLTLTLSLFCFCSLVTSKCHTEWTKVAPSACSCPRRLRVWGRSTLIFTKHSLTLQKKKLCIFSFESATACLLWETLTWLPHLPNFRLDVLIVVFSGSDSFSRIWSHGERERGGGGGQRLNRTYRWRKLRYQ